MEKTFVNLANEIYPRTYGPRIANKIFAVIIFLILFGVAYFKFKTDVIAGIIIGCPLLFFCWTLVGPAFSKTILYKDRIVYKTWFSKREMQRDDVAGFRMIKGRRNFPVLIHKDQNKPYFLISDDIIKDPVWNAWMTIVPDLDQKAVQDIVTNVTQNSELGTTVDERQRSLDRVALIFLGLIGSCILALLLNFIDFSYTLAAAFIIQCAALLTMRRYKALFDMVSSKNPIRNYPHLILFTNIFLMVIYVHQNSFDSPSIVDSASMNLFGSGMLRLLAWGTVFGLPLFLLTRESLKGTQKIVFYLYMIILTMSYVIFGSVLSGKANSAFDHSTPVFYQTDVFAMKHESKGGPVIILDPWGPVSHSRAINVSLSEYDELVIGSPICVEYHAGMLGIPWYILQKQKCVSK